MNDKELKNVCPTHEPYKLFDSEYRFASIIWEQEPVSSGRLVKLCEETLNWKKSTTYTVLKKLCDRGILRNDDTVVTSIVKKTDVQRYESEQMVQRTFDGSLPLFVASFMSGKTLNREEVKELKRLIDKMFHLCWVFLNLPSTCPRQ